MESEDKPHDREVEVHVKSLKTNAKTEFKISEAATLRQVWDEALEEDHLDEERGPGDTFRCANGLDLTGRLESTLAQLTAEHECMDRHFEIRGPSGGA